MLWLLPALAVTPSATDLVELDWIRTPVVRSDRGTLILQTGGSSLDVEDTEEPWSRDAAIVEVSMDGGQPRRLTQGDNPGSPSFSPDGSTMAFVRDGKLLLLPLGGGEPEALELEPEPGTVAFSSDGKSLLFVGTPKAPEDLVHLGGARHFERGEHGRLYRVPLAGGEPEALTEPTLNVLDFVEKDGVIALTTSKHANAYEAAIHPALGLLRDGVYTPLEGATGCVDSVTFAPNGGRLAWIGCATGGLTDAAFVHDLRTDRTERWIADTDPTLEQLAWMPDSKRLVAQVGVRTGTELWTFGATGAPTALPVGSVLRGFALGPRGRRAYAVSSTPTIPYQLVSIDLLKGTSTLLWDPDPWAQDWTLHTTEVFSWTSPEGTPLEGLLHRPPGESKGLVVMPHGGPDGVSTRSFEPRVTYLATRGYTVFQPNYRGGVAYGRDFYAANRGRLGEIEFMDIEAGVDALIAAGKADASKLFYGGWSWGGYLTAWTIGHTDRYRAAMAGAAVVDTEVSYVGSDINHGTVADWEFTGRPWKGADLFERANPRASVTAVKTPTLILHGNADRRVPFDQGVLLYRALEDLGVEVDFWEYPGEGHGIRDPAHRVHRMESWADWYDRH